MPKSEIEKFADSNKLMGRPVLSDGRERFGIACRTYADGVAMLGRVRNEGIPAYLPLNSISGSYYVFADDYLIPLAGDPGTTVPVRDRIIGFTPTISIKLPGEVMTQLRGVESSDGEISIDGSRYDFEIEYINGIDGPGISINVKSRTRQTVEIINEGIS